MHQENLYTSPNMAGRIKDIARTREITMKSILESCDLGSNTFSHMLHGKMIASDSLARIADCLNCSVDYLLGRTDNPNVLPLNLNSGNHIVLGDCCQNNPVVIGKAAAGSEPDELEQEVIRILKELPIRKRTELLTVMYQYLDENKKKEDENLVDKS